MDKHLHAVVTCANNYLTNSAVLVVAVHKCGRAVLVPLRFTPVLDSDNKEDKLHLIPSGTQLLNKKQLGNCL